MTGFRAIVIDQQTEGGRVLAHSAEIRRVSDDILMPGAVTIDVDFSDLNYKDGLVIAGRPGVARISPLIPGIDLAGSVAASDDARWRPGDRVVLNGDGLGERHHGGFAERARVRGDALVRIPDSITAEQAAAIGTAGFTAMLAVLALERSGADPDRVRAEGSSVLVTGAAGGVGSVAVAILAKLGYPVTAATGRAQELGGYLTDLGAEAIIHRDEIARGGKPLQAQRWACAVDAVGGTTLATVLAQTRYGGAVAACGLAQSPDLPTTVLPFILRAITLIGINSVEAPVTLRETAWQRLATDLDRDTLATMTRTIPLAEAIPAAEEILAGHIHGRTVVDVRA
ncbi:NADPH:quinone dehydrogenase [Leifsonia xyli subsp. xyli]|uniref:Alcohol dehydrogenase n=2 Tax=Leifsonia xyli subsp. xyli TaxID=59736 RepID=Q6AHE3_LEIXX|nr:MDR family oxidoreductase [Leifsonia xyli]AAT88202.1 alcohol dehydrogenase [Leifsonia xyli subsp. xyli str. CTCB07]ODA90917.1 NADPH:quinone dehydrogenase [Leifsonia xyli subsp. xyli]